MGGLCVCVCRSERVGAVELAVCVELATWVVPHGWSVCVCTEASVLVLVVAVITCIASSSVAFVVVAVCRRFALSLSLSALLLATARHQTWNWVTGSPGQWVIWVIFHVRVTHRVIKV